MATVDVQYLVPVVAVVNVEAGTVERVHVADEEIRRDPEYPANYWAVKVAEEAGWPAWEFGF